MGVLRAIGGSLDSVLQEQWKEVFCCDALDEETMLLRAKKRVSERSGNTRADDRVVTNGSLLIVADGQAVIVLSQGKIVDVCTEPGAHVFTDPTHPGGLRGFFRDVGERIAFGGGDVQPLTHRVYYINTKECPGNRFQTPGPIPLHLGDERLSLGMDVSVQCAGTYAFRITDPVAFYRAITGNMEGTYPKSRLLAPLESLLLTALQTDLSAQVRGGLRPSLLPTFAGAISDFVRARFTALTEEKYGIQIVSLAIDTLEVRDLARISELQAHAALQDPEQRTAHLAGAAADAMQTAAKNE